jgi:two-component system response regulator MtrA
VLLDVMLPGQDGIAVCKEIRKISGTPIIMLTAKTETQDIVLGLEAGADDYIVKPFEPSVLTARINARLRPITSIEGPVTIGPLILDVAGHQVLRNGSQISLTPLEFNLLLTLAQKPKQVFTREMLLEKVWGYHYKADTRLVNVHVQRLRSKIEDDPDNPTIVTTVRGIGYRAG